MAFDDGVRRNICTVTAEERQRFARALLALQGDKAPGADTPAGRGDIQYWFGRIASHQQENEHRGTDFLPWHRELCNRVEDLLRQIDPELSLHYWDWNDDPRDLFTPAPHVASAEFGLPFDVSPSEAPGCRGAVLPDAAIIQAPTFQRVSAMLERRHAQARFAYFGGTMVNAHVSLHDPLGLLVHANLDRLFAMWQAQPGHDWRIDPARVYGGEDETLENVFVEPWSTDCLGHPWIAAATPLVPKSYGHASVVAPPCYDTLPTRIEVDDITNPRDLIQFRDVYAGRTFARAASFRVFGRGNLTFTVAEGPTGPYSVLTPGETVTAVHSPILYREVSIWFGYTGVTPDTSAPPGMVTIRCDQTGERFVFGLEANTIALPTSAGVRHTHSDAAGSASSRCSCPLPMGVTWTWTWRAVAAPAPSMRLAPVRALGRR
jgi:hypothetical protein